MGLAARLLTLYTLLEPRTTTSKNLEDPRLETTRHLETFGLNRFRLKIILETSWTEELRMLELPSSLDRLSEENSQLKQDY